MKLNKDQRNAIIGELNNMAYAKRTHLHVECDKEEAKLPDPFVQFLEKASKDKSLAQDFCKAMAAHIEAFVDGQELDARHKMLNDATFAVSLRNRTDANVDSTGCCWHGMTITSVFSHPELDKLINARNAKLDAIEEKWNKREAILNARQAELTLKIKLMDVPDELLKLLSQFEKTKF